MNLFDLQMNSENFGERKEFIFEPKLKSPPFYKF